MQKQDLRVKPLSWKSKLLNFEMLIASGEVPTAVRRKMNASPDRYFNLVIYLKTGDFSEIVH